MPAAEVDIDLDLVRRLIRLQRPDLASAEIRPLAFGWDNASFRVGGARVARLPRREVAAGLIDNEARWLPKLAPGLPLPIPVPEFVGEPVDGYRWRWLIAPYIPGTPAGTLVDLDVAECARQLGGFLKSLHTDAPLDAPINPFRGVPLAARDATTRKRLAVVSDHVERSRLTQLWEEALAATPFDLAPVWLHGDLHPQNLLVDDDRLSGVIDFGDITAGDPATDLAVAWSFAAEHNVGFWEAYGSVDEVLRLRARGWAIALGLAYLSSSADNPIMERIGTRTLRAVLDLS